MVPPLYKQRDGFNRRPEVFECSSRGGRDREVRYGTGETRFMFTSNRKMKRRKRYL
jgi:hypothetical protein